jgi:hypothetical protein
VRRARAVVALALALPALAACGGDEEQPTASPAPTKTPAGSAPPPSPAALPPEFMECMAEQGFKVESPADIHSAPPQVLQTCFASLHQGGG